MNQIPFGYEIIRRWEGKLSLQFSRSLRSLRVDSFRISRLGLLFSIILMMGLLAWFFLAKITLYENSTSIQLRSDGMIEAGFSEEGLRRIREGQSVVLRIDRGADQSSLTIPGMVYDTRLVKDKVILYVYSDTLKEALINGKLTGRAEVEVEYVTPAQLLVRATGKYLEGSNQIPVSPQTFPTRVPEEGA